MSEYHYAEKLLKSLYYESFQDFNRLVEDSGGQGMSWKEYMDDLIKVRNWDMEKAEKDIREFLDQGYKWEDILHYDQ